MTYTDYPLKMRLSSFILACSVSLCALAQTQVSEFNPGVVADGVNYALPRTCIVADVSAVKVVYTPGEFAKYADRYLHIGGVGQEAATTWSVTDVKVHQEGMPDSTKYYTIKLKDKTIAPMATLTENGIIAAINQQIELDECLLPNSVSTHNRLDAKQYLTEDILSATNIAKMAELTAQEILDVRESKNAIKRGQVESMPKDGASLKIVLDELDMQERALTQMFVGYTDTTTCYQSYSMCPDADVAEQVLFRFSRKLGFLAADNLAGDPYYVTIKDLHSVPKPTAAEAAKRKIQGVVYNMPGMGKVTVSTMDRTVYERDLPFAQFGTIDVLNPTLFNKGATTKVTYNTATGGIMKIEQ